MSIHTSALADGRTSIDIKRKPLSVRSLSAGRTVAVSILERVRGEFAEMRGFSPTLAQAARLFGMTMDECDRVLRSLVQEGSLRLGEDGRYRLAD
jgi:hypothetical protein